MQKRKDGLRKEKMITKKSNQPVRMWVSPAFKRKLKAKASEEGFKLIDYTDKLAKHMKSDLIKKDEDLFPKNDTRKMFDFRI